MCMCLAGGGRTGWQAALEWVGENIGFWGLLTLWEQGECCACVCVWVVVGWVVQGAAGLWQSLGGLCGVMTVCVVSLDYLCRWQVQVSVYYARRVPAHLRCTQCSILLHPIDIFFLRCICLWQISQIQTCFALVVGPGLVSTSLVSAIQRVRMAGLPKNGQSGTHCWGQEGLTQFAQRFAGPLWQLHRV